MEGFKDQDAVVSVIAGPAIRLQSSIIDAAIKAGVKRFIPSEFGINTRSLVEGSGLAKILDGKIKSVDHLEAVAAANPNFTWTGLSTSLFFDRVCPSSNNTIGTIKLITWKIGSQSRLLGL